MSGRLAALRPGLGPLRPRGFGGPLTLGLGTCFLSLIVLIPLAAVIWRSQSDGADTFWAAISSPRAVSALQLTVGISLAVALINTVMGILIAWVLVRDRFPGRRLVDALIDMPFALPTIVAGLTMIALYGPRSPLGVDVAYTRAGIALALLFVTLPFVVRAVQPVLMELDREVEDAAASLGAKPRTIFLRVILPNLRPAVLTGVGLAFSRALGEFGSVVLIAGNVPFKTELSSVLIFGHIESGNPAGAAAVSVVLLAISLVVLVGLSIGERMGGDRAR
ncbi:MAG: sulfate/thiosulfate transport system permease protein [Miltoncostaeaceae bacterium]|nr:sulfate/thiosulfate transport system permease protein [Miltoncostaeaceae bacterium]